MLRASAIQALFRTNKIVEDNEIGKSVIGSEIQVTIYRITISPVELQYFFLNNYVGFLVSISIMFAKGFTLCSLCFVDGVCSKVGHVPLW
jgi:hypothetical protein